MLRDFCKEEFDIVIQAGQSNSAGYGFGVTATPYIQNSDILYLINDFTISVAQEAVLGNEIIGNFSLAFCTRYIESGKLQCGRKLLIIRAAIGGTGFLDNRWGMNDDLYLKMIEMVKTALELNPKNKLVTFLWHQGETDAILNANKQMHFNNLFMLVNSVRDIFNCKTLPFIAGDFVSQWKNDNIEICVPVIEAIKEVCTSISHAQFVETNGLQSNDQKINNQDPIHFCRESLNQLGIRYYNSFCDITK
jgi:hypothetical protein